MQFSTRRKKIVILGGGCGGDQGLQAKLVALDLLASNFHDSLDLSPLFWQIDPDVKRAPEGKRTAHKQMGQVELARV